MNFKKEDENYIYGVIGKNVKKYRKLKHLTQAELAEKIDYSLSFVSGLESKKHQTFSLGALWRISLILGVDMYKLCIDESEQNLSKPKYISYKCQKCNFKTEIPTDLIEIANKANTIYQENEKKLPTFPCSNCDGYIIPNDEL